jgi:ribosome biogenesis protein ENP2
MRVPKFGRDMIYQPHSCELITVGASNEIYRLNLDLGRFTAPLVTGQTELNCVKYGADLDLTAVGGIDGGVEFWDFREK